MITIKFEIENNRAVALDGSKIAGECSFSVSGNVWNIVYTGVDSAYQGQGIARRLVECVIANANKEHVTLEADCSYAKKVIG